MKSLTIVSRKSVLAQLQSFEVAEAIKENFPDIEINFLTKETTGDIDLTTPLHKMPEMGVFTCLLYTSPSPRDATLSRMPSSA